MPIYEFECTACGVRFDRLQKLSDPDPIDCPECAQPKIQRRLSAPRFRLAGSGWYETDFKGDKDKKRNLVDKNESFSESKPDTTAETKTTDTPSKPGDSVTTTRTSTNTTGAE